MSFKFEKLRIWKMSMNYADEIDLMTNNLPEKENFNLNSQIRRAADSIALNIAEGSIGQSNPEQRKFIGYSIRSLSEVITCLHKIKTRNYITEDVFDDLYGKSLHLMNMLVAFRKSIK